MGGGSYSKRLGELSLVDSDSTQQEEHAYIGHSSEWAKFFELGGFESWNFCPKISLFFGFNVDFLATRRTWKGSNENLDLKLLHVKKIR